MCGPKSLFRICHGKIPHLMHLMQAKTRTFESWEGTIALRCLLPGGTCACPRREAEAGPPAQQAETTAGHQGFAPRLETEPGPLQHCSSPVAPFFQFCKLWFCIINALVNWYFFAHLCSRFFFQVVAQTNCFSTKIPTQSEVADSTFLGMFLHFFELLHEEIYM